MAYIPTVYRDNDPTTPLSAANLNKSEQGIKIAHDEIARVEGKTDSAIVEVVNSTVASVVPVAVQKEVAGLNLDGVDEGVLVAKINDAISKLPPAQLDTEAVKRVVSDTLSEQGIMAVDENALAKRILDQVTVPQIDDVQLGEKITAAVNSAVSGIPKLHYFPDVEQPDTGGVIAPGSLGYTGANKTLWVHAGDSWEQLGAGGSEVDWSQVDTRVQQAIADFGGTVDGKISDAISKIEIPKVPDSIKPVGLFNRIYQRGQRKLAVPTYWWADSDYNQNSNWNFIFRNADIVPFVLINPRSGAGDKAEPDFIRHLTKLKAIGIPAIVYVRTVTDLANRVMRPKQDIMAEVSRYMEFYGRENISGIFFDEVYNGWDEKYRAQQDEYLSIFKEARETYGDDFLIVVNPGSPTTNYLIDSVDVIMCFEQNPQTLRNSVSNLSPEWYRSAHPGKLWLAIHDVASEAEAREVLSIVEKLNAANVYLTTDKFSGVIGSESPDNNPWDNLPEQWLQDLQTDWMRHNLLPETVRSYAGQAGKTIHIVRNQNQANLLPIGSLYAIVEALGVRTVGTAGGNVNSNVFDATVSGTMAGDRVIVGINTRGVSDMTIRPPEGFTQIVDGYWAGTQRSWLFEGVINNTSPLVFTASTGAEFGWAAVAVRGSTGITIGKFKSRADEPVDSGTVVTAPAVDATADDMVLGFSFERTSGGESDGQVTLSPGWEKLHYTPQGTNFQTALIAKGGSGAMVATYPNSQDRNGGGVQVVLRG